MEQDYTTTELEQAERLEHYLAGLERGQLIPENVNQSEVGLYRTARQFSTAKLAPSQLTVPLTIPLRQRFKLRTWALWLTPLPLIAAATLIYFTTLNPQQTSIDIASDLALVEQSDRDLLAMEQELNASLTEIDLLTSTDYIDQL